MPVALVQSLALSTSSGPTPGETRSGTLTVSDGTYLVVTIGTLARNGAVLKPATPTVDGVAMVPLYEEVHNGGDLRSRSYVYGFSGHSAGSVTISTVVGDTEQMAFVMAAAEYSGVDLTKTPDSAGGFVSGTFGSSATVTATAPITGVAGGALVGFASGQKSNSISATTSGDTVVHDLDTGTADFSDVSLSVVLHPFAETNPEVVTFTLDPAPSVTSYGAFALYPAASGGGGETGDTYNIKTGGAYSEISSLSVKTAGIYVTGVAAFLKQSGSYVPFYLTPDYVLEPTESFQVTAFVSVDDYVDGLPATAGRTSANALKDPTAGLPAGWQLNGNRIETMAGGSTLADYDVEGYDIYINHAFCTVEQCEGGEKNGVSGVSQYILIGEGGIGYTIRRNTFTGYDGYDGAGTFIQHLRSGSGANVTTATGGIISHNAFSKAYQDYIKLRGGTLVEFNYFGRPANYPAGTTLYDSGQTYNAGDYVLSPLNSGSLGLFRALQTTTGNAPATNKSDTAYWDNLDPHTDFITVDGMTGQAVIRFNYFDRDATQAVGVNNALRAARNNGTAYEDARFDWVIFYGNFIAALDVNAETIQVSDGVGTNWFGGVEIRHNRIGKNGSGNHIYPSGIPAGTIWDQNRDAETGDYVAAPSGTTAETTLAPNLGDLPPFWGAYSADVSGSVSVNDFSTTWTPEPWLNSSRHLGRGYGECQRQITAPSGAEIEMRGVDSAGTPTMWQWVGSNSTGGAEAMTVHLPEHVLAMAVTARIKNHGTGASATTSNRVSVGPVGGGFDQSNGSRQFQLSNSGSLPAFIPPEYENLVFVTWGEHSNNTDDNRTWHIAVPVNNDTSGYNGGTPQVSATSVRIALALAKQTGGKTRIHICGLMYSGTSADDMLSDDVGGERDWFPPHGDTVGLRAIEDNGGTFDFMGMIWFPPQTGAWQENTDYWFLGILFGRDRATGDPLVPTGTGEYEILGDAFTPRTIKHLISDEVKGAANLTTKAVWSYRGERQSRYPLRDLLADPIWQDHVGIAGSLSGALIGPDGSHFHPDMDDGMPLYGELYWSFLARAAGLTTWTVPKIDHVRWEADYIELWSDAGPITTRRNLRGGSSTTVWGPDINYAQVPCELVGGRIRIPNTQYTAGDTLTYAEKGYGGVKNNDPDYLDVAVIDGSLLGAEIEAVPLEGTLESYITDSPGGDR